MYVNTVEFEFIQRMYCSSPFIHYNYRDWYQHGALLSSEEGVIIAGLLVGLNTIDYNVVTKGEDFDKPVRHCVYSSACVCMYACIHVCMYGMYVYVHVCMWVCEYVCAYVCMNMYVYVCACVYVHACTYGICARACVYVSMSMCPCVYCVHIYTSLIRVYISDTFKYTYSTLYICIY